MTDAYPGEDERVRLMGDNTCPRIRSEIWYLGNRYSPDGPPRYMDIPCILQAGHNGPHLWGKAVHRDLA
jgi:hypothetical protein